MEVTGNRKQKAYAAITRVYSPTKGSSAYAYAQTAEVAQPIRTPQPVVGRKPMRRQAKAQLRPGTKIAFILSMLVFTAALLFVIFRYYTITRNYAMVVELNSNITAAGRRIRELNVALNGAVNIQEAKEAAERLDLTYPTADQYIRAGDTLTINGSQDVESAGPDNDPAEPEPDTQEPAP